MAELFIGTMHGYARDLLQTYVPLTFKRNVLTTSRRGFSSTGTAERAGSQSPTRWSRATRRKLKRFVETPLWMQVLSILREDDVDEALLAPELVAAVTGYRKLLAEKNYFDFTELLRVAVDLLAEEPTTR